MSQPQQSPVIVDTTGLPIKPIHERQTSCYITKYERARILGTRALQLSMNAVPYVDVGDEIDPFTIATLELKAQKIPFILKRELSSNVFEYWPVPEMQELPM